MKNQPKIASWVTRSPRNSDFNRHLGKILPEPSSATCTGLLSTARAYTWGDISKTRYLWQNLLQVLFSHMKRFVDVGGKNIWSTLHGFLLITVAQSELFWAACASMGPSSSACFSKWNFDSTGILYSSRRKATIESDQVLHRRSPWWNLRVAFFLVAMVKTFAILVVNCPISQNLLQI